MFRCPEESKRFLFSPKRPELLYDMGVRREVDHLSLFDAEVDNEWSSTSKPHTPSYFGASIITGSSVSNSCKGLDRPRR